MDVGTRDALRVFAWIAAFGTALLLGHRTGRLGRAQVCRLALGLVLGAAAARLGFWWLHSPAPDLAARLWRDPFQGFSALFVPFGVLAAAPWLRRGAPLAEHLEAALPPLPLALAVAKLGCLAGRCCHGVAFAALPMAEIAGLAAVVAALGPVGAARRPGVALAGIGAVRLASEALRAPSPLGPPRVAAAWIAALELVIGVVLQLRPPVPTGESS